MNRRLSIALAYAMTLVLCAACAGVNQSASQFAALAATLPHEVGDEQLDVKPATIAEMVSGESDEPFRRVLAEAGKTPADVSLAVERNRFPELLHVVIWAMHVRGLDARLFTQSLYAAYNHPLSNFSSEVIHNHDVLTSADDGGGLTIIYCPGEVAYIIRAIRTPPMAGVPRTYAEELLARVLPARF